MPLRPLYHLRTQVRTQIRWHPSRSARREMTDDLFDQQLPWRVQEARPTLAQKDYALYVRLARACLGMRREELSQRTGLERSFLAFLENCLLLPEELTEEVREKIEQAFGIPYPIFRQLKEYTVPDTQQI